MVDDECALVQDAVRALDEAFAVYQAERDADGRVVGLLLRTVNATGGRWFGIDPKVPSGPRPVSPDRPEIMDALWPLIATTVGTSQVCRERVSFGEGPSGSTLEVQVAPFGVDLVVVTCRDITERVTGERLLEQAYRQAANARATLQTALDATSDAFAVYDVIRDRDHQIDRLRLVMINAAGAAPLGVGPHNLVGWDLREVAPEAEASGLWGAIGEALEAEATRTIRLHRHDGEGHWVASDDATVAPVGTERVVLTWRDVTADERRGRDLARAHDQAWHAATHDPLTGLANRALLAEQMREGLWSADDDNRVAVVYVDLDRFKQVNDNLGHAAGDDLLRAVAGRLAGVIRTGDLAARVGGDEFVLLLRNVRQEWDTERFLQRVRRAVEQPVLLAEALVTPQASYGVAISPPASRDLDVLLREADGLMYQDKLSRR